MRMAEALAAVLDPGGPDDAAAKMMSVRRLLAATGVGIASRETGMGAIDGYMEALADIPAWAVEEARRRWLRAEAGPQDYDWAPRPPRLRLICLEIIAPLRQALDHIREVLDARPLDDVLEEKK